MTKQAVRDVERMLQKQVWAKLAELKDEGLDVETLTEEEKSSLVSRVVAATVPELKKWTFLDEDNELDMAKTMAYIATGATAILISALAVGTAPLTTAGIGIAAGATACRVVNNYQDEGLVYKGCGLLGTGAAKVVNLFSRKAKAEVL